MSCDKSFEREEELQRQNPKERTHNPPKTNKQKKPKLDVDNLGYQGLETFLHCVVVVGVGVGVVCIRLQTSHQKSNPQGPANSKRTNKSLTVF